jgi:hypothetical protein
MRACVTISVAVLAILSGRLLAQNDSDSNEAPQSYASIVAADAPAFWWRFEEGKVEPGEIVGKVTLNVAGPRKERYPKFDDKNLAAQFAIDGGRIVVKDAGEKSPLDFAAGDAITLEAWVNPTKLASGQTVYVLGKGRTGNAGVARTTRTTVCGWWAPAGRLASAFSSAGPATGPVTTKTGIAGTVSRRLPLAAAGTMSP